MSRKDHGISIGGEYWLKRHVRGWGRVKVLYLRGSGSSMLAQVKDLQDGDQYPALIDSLKEHLTPKEREEAASQATVTLADMEAASARRAEALAAIDRQKRVIQDAKELIEAWRKYGEGTGPKPK